MAKDFKASAAGAGLDWEKLIDFVTSLNWVELMAFIGQLISIFRGRRGVAKAAHSHEEACVLAKAHFDCIVAVAQCGADCCTTHGT